MIKSFHRLLCLFTTAASLMAAVPAYSLSEDAQAAKEEGMRLYNADQREASLAYLEVAAEAGDVDSMFYLGEASFSSEWLYRAAQQGDVYAMFYLTNACKWDDICPEGGESWVEAAVPIALERAEAGDSEAMFALYLLYTDLRYEDEPRVWLERAAEAGNVEAQLKLGAQIRDGQTHYSSEAERLNAAEKWFRRAADAGYPRAMSSLARLLHKQGDDDEAWAWMVRASDAGHINARQWLAYCYIDPEDEKNGICQVEQDPAEGWAILLAVNEEAPNIHVENALHYFEDTGRVPQEEREEGERRMMEWLNREPPLSYFPMKFFGP